MGTLRAQAIKVRPVKTTQTQADAGRLWDGSDYGWLPAPQANSYREGRLVTTRQNAGGFDQDQYAPRWRGRYAVSSPPARPVHGRQPRTDKFRRRAWPSGRSLGNPRLHGRSRLANTYFPGPLTLRSEDSPAAEFSLFRRAIPQH